MRPQKLPADGEEQKAPTWWGAPRRRPAGSSRSPGGRVFPASHFRTEAHSRAEQTRVHLPVPRARERARTLHGTPAVMARLKTNLRPQRKPETVFACGEARVMSERDTPMRLQMGITRRVHHARPQEQVHREANRRARGWSRASQGDRSTRDPSGCLARGWGDGEAPFADGGTQWLHSDGRSLAGKIDGLETAGNATFHLEVRRSVMWVRGHNACYRGAPGHALCRSAPDGQIGHRHDHQWVGLSVDHFRVGGDAHLRDRWGKSDDD